MALSPVRQMLSSMLLRCQLGRAGLGSAAIWSRRRLVLTCTLRLCAASLAAACIPVRVLPPLPFQRRASPLHHLEAFTLGSYLNVEVGILPEGQLPTLGSPHTGQLPFWQAS